MAGLLYKGVRIKTTPRRVREDGNDGWTGEFLLCHADARGERCSRFFAGGLFSWESEAVASSLRLAKEVVDKLGWNSAADRDILETLGKTRKTVAQEVRVFCGKALVLEGSMGLDLTELRERPGIDMPLHHLGAIEGGIRTGRRHVDVDGHPYVIEYVSPSEASGFV